MSERRPALVPPWIERTTPDRHTVLAPARAAPWLLPFAKWLRRKRWAANVARCQRIRETLGFRARMVFDAELQPWSHGHRIAYPDAFYHVTIEDVCRAHLAAILSGPGAVNASAEV